MFTNRARAHYVTNNCTTAGADQVLCWLRESHRPQQYSLSSPGKSHHKRHSTTVTRSSGLCGYTTSGHATSGYTTAINPRKLGRLAVAALRRHKTATTKDKRHLVIEIGVNLSQKTLKIKKLTLEKLKQHGADKG